MSGICLQLFVCFIFCNITACCYGIMSNKQIILVTPSISSPLHPLPGLGPALQLPVFVEHTGSRCKCTHLVYSASALLFPEQKVSVQDLKLLVSVHLLDSKRKSTNCICSTHHHILETTYCNHIIHRIC